MSRLHLFDAFGVEVEYMIVDRDSLDVRAVCDNVLSTAAGHPTGDIQFGDATYSNELALHVIELKGSRPTADLPALATSMDAALQTIAPALSTHGVMLLPTAMHPWMNPTKETRLWPHEYHEIYHAYHNVFDCYRHGWANVQSVHLNLPFDGDDEFARLHAAVRLLLPLLPALAASSPIVGGQADDWADARMRFVRDHCDRVPFLTGQMIPEAIYDEATYRREIFGGLETAIAPFDDSGVFDANFLNARGAIARFDRGSIEIRVMDVQECPAADVAICAITIEVLKTLVATRWTSWQDQSAVSTESLARLLDQVSQHAGATVIDDADYLAHFGITTAPMTAGEVWKTIADSLAFDHPMVSTILDRGSLSTRIRSAIGGDFRREHLVEVYRRLGDCLMAGRSFQP